MDSQEYQNIQNLRKNLHEAKKNDNKNMCSTQTVQKIQEQLTSSGCGLQQINE